ncbi:hypothetical protein HG535_0B03180 [Zygotorulaspora mrakii]|uniref:Uncharacterized protein n=1 Tax=Zygotorulaspora mrakii TaxID=42260 RepID=A0A7H9AZW8_ZYGMR|nr:uncharacterized protein HG535_0B03180 [Zygotorulaspora mrakii]QLG71279.1 hypothetical protein HG535_0B03180 [Zygotorulaspora mrakii]
MACGVVSGWCGVPGRLRAPAPMGRTAFGVGKSAWRSEVASRRRYRRALRRWRVGPSARTGRSGMTRSVRRMWCAASLGLLSWSWCSVWVCVRMVRTSAHHGAHVGAVFFMSMSDFTVSTTRRRRASRRLRRHDAKKSFSGQADASAWRWHL